MLSFSKNKLSVKNLVFFTYFLFSLIVLNSAYSLPVDWHGSFGVDTTLINSYRRIKSSTDRTSANNGSQEVGLTSGNKASASWQSYIMRLAPSIIVNDAATLRLEMTTGYANGGYLGDSPKTDKNNTRTIPLHYYNQSAGSNLNLTQAYAEMFSDTATYLVGRHTYHWGLGAIYNEGKNPWERLSSSRDGITMKLKIGNFEANPFWSKSTNTGLTSTTDSREYGIGLIYDNKERDIAFGLIYSIKGNGPSNSSTTSIETSNQTYGKTDIKITDIYLKAEWERFSLGLEVPLLSGELGYANNSNRITKFSTKAILLQTQYKKSESWKFNLDLGHVAGHDGSSAKYGAMYLNPNFQIANLLFRYNINAIQNPTANDSIYDSYITNAQFAKLSATYDSEKWTIRYGIIYAKAIETATTGRAAYNHTKHKIFTANATQSDDLGTEIDLNADYKWNQEINIGLGAAYLLTGDYFSYSNNASVINEKKNSLLFQANTIISF